MENLLDKPDKSLGKVEPLRIVDVGAPTDPPQPDARTNRADTRASKILFIQVSPCGHLKLEDLHFIPVSRVLVAGNR
jgi:hypothetical protein